MDGNIESNDISTKRIRIHISYMCTWWKKENIHGIKTIKWSKSTRLSYRDLKIQFYDMHLTQKSIRDPIFHKSCYHMPTYKS